MELVELGTMDVQNHPAAEALSDHHVHNRSIEREPAAGVDMDNRRVCAAYGSSQGPHLPDVPSDPTVKRFERTVCKC